MSTRRIGPRRSTRSASRFDCLGFGALLEPFVVFALAWRFGVDLRAAAFFFAMTDRSSVKAPTELRHQQRVGGRVRDVLPGEELLRAAFRHVLVAA